MDIISRQTVVDEIEERKNANGYRNVAVISELNRLEGYIMRLPSAQPEQTNSWCINSWCIDCKEYDTENKCCPRYNRVIKQTLDDAYRHGETEAEARFHAQQRWIPCSERLPSKEERKEWIDKNLGGIGYLYPCLVTRYSSINPDRTKNNPYVAKHYYDGEDFVNNGEEVCSKYIIAWMPLPEPYKDGE